VVVEEVEGRKQGVKWSWGVLDSGLPVWLCRVRVGVEALHDMEGTFQIAILSSLDIKGAYFKLGVGLLVLGYG